MILNAFKVSLNKGNWIRKNHSNTSSKAIRNQFLDYFITDHGHKFVKSSSVIPFCDSTLAFTNAGMNQFKNVLTGNQRSKFKKVANSQKCVRVGGKHNDLKIVGTDSYHHTFFEMLGNWSFGDYFKKDACFFAWNLLTKVYNINPNRIYVTYFSGDDKLQLPIDLECREIWRALGVKEERIVGFGTKENFWEMGETGPCGGCTEIHIDHSHNFQNKNRSRDVNADLSDLTELWNLVFIEYFRHSDGSISKLPQQHVDTGMGFERLVAFLQNKSSNYDTDLFRPIFDEITKQTQAPKYSGKFSVNDPAYNLDTAYRILSDHSRMVSVCLADGMFPEQNHKLRRVLRKSIQISEKDFKNGQLLIHLMPKVAEILGDTYPELHDKLPVIQNILQHEHEIYKHLRDITSNEVKQLINSNPQLIDFEFYDYPGFYKGFTDLCDYKKKNGNSISGQFMFHLYSTHGFDLEVLEKLAEIENMTLDKPSFKECMQKMKNRFSVTLDCDLFNSVLDNLGIEKTDNSDKYNYFFDEQFQEYHIKPLKTKILAIISDNMSMKNTKDSTSNSAFLIVQKSPFYVESGGQESDSGFLLRDNIKYPLVSLSVKKDYLLHEIKLTDLNQAKYLEVGDDIEMIVDCKKRTKIIRNHSGTHLFNAAIRKLVPAPIYQKSSLVSSENFKIELAVFGQKLNVDHVLEIEKFLRCNIKDSTMTMETKVIDSQQLLQERNVTLIPGETYPDSGIRLISFIGDNFESKELCCGTHAFNSRELYDFTLLNVKSTGKSGYLFTAITGKDAENAEKLGNHLVEELLQIKDNINKNPSHLKTIYIDFQKTKLKLKDDDLFVSYICKQNSLKLLQEINEIIKTESRTSLGELIDIEMKLLTENNSEKFVVHYLSCSELMKSVSLQKATRYVNDRPILILSATDNILKARCCIPKEFVSNQFNAEIWLQVVSGIFKAQVAPPKGQNVKEVCLMKPKKLTGFHLDDKITEAIQNAKDFATKYVNSYTK